MKSKDQKLTEVVILLLIGRLSLPIGLTLLLMHAFFGRPEHAVRPLVGTATGLILLAAAASRLNDAKLLTFEIVRGLAFACLLIAATATRLYFHRVPHGLTAHESIAGLACAVGFVASTGWLRRARVGS